MCSIKIKGFYLSINLLLCSLMTFAQATFNLTYPHGTNTFTTSVWEWDSHFFSSGYYVDSSGYYQTFVSRHLPNGEEEIFKSYVNDTIVWIAAWDVDVQVGDGIFIKGAIKYVNDTEEACLIWTNENCDTLFTRSYISPYFNSNLENDDWMRTLAIDKDPNGNLYLTSQVFQDDGTYNDFFIMKLNAQGDALWSYLVNEEGSEYCMDIEAMDDGVLIAGGGVNNNSSQTFIKLNSDGIWQWQFDLDEQNWPINIPNEIIVESDGIVVSCEYTYDGSFYRLPAVLKTNFEGEIQWIVMRPGSDIAYQYNNHIVKSQDGGYLAAAWQYEENPSDPEVNGDYNWNAWLIKVSHEGVLEWERFYHFVESTEDKHRVYDLKATNDGGYIFCGDAIDQDVESNGQVTQKGWLVKVDACGCLVPGCDVDCTIGVGEESAAKKYFIFGPNPASQYLNVYFSEGIPDAIVSIYDLNGKRLDSFIPRQGKTTYMLNVESYTSGTYILSCEKDGLLLQSERITIQ